MMIMDIYTKCNLLLSALIVLISVRHGHCQGGQRVSRSYSSSSYGNSPSSTGNVTCIAHDAKFTCNCQNIIQPLILPILEGSVFEVEISNCIDLTITSDALQKTESLHKITFKNIDKLVLHKDALSFSRYASNLPVSVEFEKVNIDVIDSHAINGNIKSITFVGGSINNIHPFGFTTLQQEFLLRLDNVLIRKIHPQAFKKFSIERMEILNCIFESNIPSKAFYEVEINDYLRIDNSHFNEIHTRALSFKKISKLSITNSYFNGIDAEWMEAHVLDNVNIQSNNFGRTSTIAFKAIYVHRDYVASEKLELRFHNNTVHDSSNFPKALVFNEQLSLSIKQLRYNNQYSCQDVDMEQDPPQSLQLFFRTHSDVIYFLGHEVTGSTKTTTATQQDNFIKLSTIIENDCRRRSYWLYIGLGVLALLVLLMIIAALVWMQVAKKRKLRKMVVLPETRTYKETQIVYQIENAGLLKTDL